MAKSRSSSFISRIDPAWTKPAQLNRMSTRPISATAAFTSASLSTSSLRVWIFFSPEISASTVSLMSVACTVAPALANASALARPMPCAAAVISTILP